MTDEQRTGVKIVLEGQYKEAYELLEDAVACGLTPIIIGPPGVGKSLLVRKFAIDTSRPFYEIFFDELLRPYQLIGSFNPVLVLQKGYSKEAFEPGHLLRSMMEGGVFVAQELNRASEFCQNSLLEPLEERSYYVPMMGRIWANEKFTFIATANPAELAGVHRLSEALRDRLRVWIPLTYPDKETELKIIKMNCEPASLDEDILNEIYAVLKVMRESKDVEIPASVRAGISIAKLVANYISQHGKISNEIFVNYAVSVLLGASKAKEWMVEKGKVEQLIRDSIIHA